MSLPRPFEVLNVFGGKSKSNAPKAFKFGTKWVPIEVNNWWKFGVDISNHFWEIQNLRFFLFQVSPTMYENSFWKLSLFIVGDRVSQICTFLSNLKIYVYHNFFPLFRIKVLQKTKFWKFLCIFWPGLTRPKFYTITHLWDMELSIKSIFFQIFHYKTMYSFQK